MSAGDDPTLDFEAWTELSASFLDRSPEERLVVLDERHIAPEDWERWDGEHLRALAADLAAGRMERANAYAQACAAEIERRKGASATPDAEAAPAQGAALPEDEPPEAAASEDEPTLAPAEPAVVEAATFQKPPDATAPAPAEPSSAPSPGPQLRPSLSGTVTGFEVPVGLREAAAKLPFSPAPPGPPRPTYASGAVPASQAPTDAAGGPAPQGRITNLGSTLPVSTQPRSALPFQGAPASPVMALQTYASIRAELRVFPERAGEILTKYQIAGDAAWRALDQEWQARLAKLPETRATFERLLASYEEWLRKQPR